MIHVFVEDLKLDGVLDIEVGENYSDCVGASHPLSNGYERVRWLVKYKIVQSFLRLIYDNLFRVFWLIRRMHLLF